MTGPDLLNAVSNGGALILLTLVLWRIDRSVFATARRLEEGLCRIERMLASSNRRANRNPPPRSRSAPKRIARRLVKGS